MKETKVKLKRAYIDRILEDGSCFIKCEFDMNGSVIAIEKNNIDESTGNVSTFWDIDCNVEIISAGESQDIVDMRLSIIQKAIQNGEDNDDEIVDIYLAIRDDFDQQDCENMRENFIDRFKENFCDDVKSIEKTLGRFPRQQELADYLGVNKSTVSGYPKNKKDLMLHGIWLKRKFNEK